MTAKFYGVGPGFVTRKALDIRRVGRIFCAAGSTADNPAGKWGCVEMLREADRGVLLNLTGDGKGKSSSAFGIAVRALGWNWNLAILQFLKGNRPTGERNFFTKYFPEMIFEDLGLGITTCPGDHAGAARRGWERAKELLTGFDGELLILDELNVALHNGYLSVAEVVPALAGRREKLNVVITGRGAPQELLAVSDLVSEVRAIRHPFRTGVPAKKGIDY